MPVYAPNTEERHYWRGLAALRRQLEPLVPADEYVVLEVVKAPWPIASWTWVPMAEYLRDAWLPMLRRMRRIVAPSRAAARWLAARGLSPLLIPWEVPAPLTAAAPTSGEGRMRVLHFARPYNLKKSATRAVLEAWPAMRAWADLTVKTPDAKVAPWREAMPPGVRLVAGHLSAQEMEALYAAHDVVLQPSLSEGIGLPILEARARGRVTVVPAGGVLDEWALPGVPRVLGGVASTMAAVRECLTTLQAQAQAWAREEHGASYARWEDGWRSAFST